MTTRFARLTLAPTAENLRVVKRYLPANYSAVTDAETNQILVYGTDSRGWTLDGYVLPRLASGNIYGTEVDS